MDHRHAILALTALAVLLYTTASQAAIRTRNVEYRQGETVLEGYLVYDDSQHGVLLTTYRGFVLLA